MKRAHARTTAVVAACDLALHIHCSLQQDGLPDSFLTGYHPASPLKVPLRSGTRGLIGRQPDLDRLLAGDGTKVRQAAAGRG
ncbi:MAG: hypothetical protein AB7R89_03430 [Dehalococcoidia bacterium]